MVYPNRLMGIIDDDLFKIWIIVKNLDYSKAQAFLDRGELVPDHVVIAMVEGRLSKPDAAKGFILDGFPRTVPQAEALGKALLERHVPLGLVIYFETSEAVIIRRLSGRRSCPKCGMNFHVKNIPPKKEGFCDRCGEALIQRKDDNEETVRHRLEVYHHETEPLIRYYKERGLLQKTSGDFEVPEQLAAIRKLCEEFVH